MPSDAYGGAYIIDIAKDIVKADGDHWLAVDDDKRHSAFRQIGMEKMLGWIKSTLDEFGNKSAAKTSYLDNDAPEVVVPTLEGLNEYNYTTSSVTITLPVQVDLISGIARQYYTYVYSPSFTEPLEFNDNDEIIVGEKRIKVYCIL